jgi:hypothetical protein
MKRYDYEEGRKARQDFEKGMKALFQVPKDPNPAKKKKPAKKRAKKTSESGPSRDSGGEV